MDCCRGQLPVPAAAVAGAPPLPSRRAAHAAPRGQAAAPCPLRVQLQGRGGSRRLWRRCRYREAAILPMHNPASGLVVAPGPRLGHRPLLSPPSNIFLNLKPPPAQLESCPAHLCGRPGGWHAPCWRCCSRHQCAAAEFSEEAGESPGERGGEGRESESRAETWNAHQPIPSHLLWLCPAFQNAKGNQSAPDQCKPRPSLPHPIPPGLGTSRRLVHASNPPHNPTHPPSVPPAHPPTHSSPRPPIRPPTEVALTGMALSEAPGSWVGSGVPLAPAWARSA